MKIEGLTKGNHSRDFSLNVHIFICVEIPLEACINTKGGVDLFDHLSCVRAPLQFIIIEYKKHFAGEQIAHYQIQSKTI